MSTLQNLCKHYLTALDSAFQQALDYYQEINDQTNGWVNYKTTPEQAQYFINKKKHSYWIWMGEMKNVEIPESIAKNSRDLIKYLDEESERKLWDEEFVSGVKIHDKIEKNCNETCKNGSDHSDFNVYYRVFTVGSKAVSNREFVISRNIYQDPKLENVTWMCNQTPLDFPDYEHKKAPTNSSCVRGTVHVTAWRFEQLKSSISGKSVFNISVISHSEPGGWVTASFFNNGAGDRPASAVVRLVKYLQSKQN
ncbi:predicted protein [Naegleria gruberi]|uniref:Predicted protein n=1 Tax=Naegleria gruberi TaxID=5762 RepID=D2VR75_NAEGR|nr:uncharacterized protein NAEGRDRAFT_71487 [Naegleria gruberi]EFC40554.1 predicted protein [Naegleria gruberi]|eukprot:XP_002673298.1 predicted protein [Naegleria gruberi strain NEG-M]